MRTRIIWLTVVLLIGFIGLNSSQAQENILENGGFEDGNTTAWSTYGPVTGEGRGRAASVTVAACAPRVLPPPVNPILPYEYRADSRSFLQHSGRRNVCWCAAGVCAFFRLQYQLRVLRYAVPSGPPVHAPAAERAGRGAH